MIHRRQLDLGGLERAKTPFDNQETFIAGGGVFLGNGVIVGDQHPFAIIPGSLLHGLAVEPNTVRVLVDFQITLIAAGGQQIDGSAGRGFGLWVFFSSASSSLIICCRCCRCRFASKGS